MLSHSISILRQTYCGRCSAEYLIDNRWLKYYIIIFILVERASVLNVVLSI